MKKYIVVLALLVLSTFHLSAQIMPTVRIPDPEETKIIHRINSWHATAVASSIMTGSFLSIGAIYSIEKREAEFKNKSETDKVIINVALVLAGTSAVLTGVSWTVYSKEKKKLGDNKLLLKTTPSGLIIEF